MKKGDLNPRVPNGLILWPFKSDLKWLAIVARKKLVNFLGLDHGLGFAFRHTKQSNNSLFLALIYTYFMQISTNSLGKDPSHAIVFS